MDVQGDLDLGLRVLYGRDRWRLPLLSDALREASGQLLVIRVTGTPSFPKFKLAASPRRSTPSSRSASAGRARRRRSGGSVGHE